MLGPASSPAIRIHQGETIVGQAWSNTATQLWGFFRILYDDGTEDEFTIKRTLLLNTRVQGQLECNRIAKQDGYVIQGQICQVSGVANQATQRGQCFVRVVITADVGAALSLSPSSCKAMLLSGYIYSGFEPCVGQYVEAGPANGHGAITRVFKASTAVAGSTGLVLGAVPTGALWRWIYIRADYTATATAGTRALLLEFRDGSANIFVTGPAAAPTSAQKAAFRVAPNLSSELTVVPVFPGGTANVGVEFASPDRHLPANYDLFIADGANVDVLDTIVLEAQVEEWVVPN